MNLAPRGSCTSLPQSSHTVVLDTGEMERRVAAELGDEQLGAVIVDDEIDAFREEAVPETDVRASRAATSEVIGRLMTVTLLALEVSSMATVEKEADTDGTV